MSAFASLKSFLLVVENSCRVQILPRTYLSPRFCTEKAEVSAMSVGPGEIIGAMVLETNINSVK